MAFENVATNVARKTARERNNQCQSDVGWHSQMSQFSIQWCFNGYIGLQACTHTCMHVSCWAIFLDVAVCNCWRDQVKRNSRISHLAHACGDFGEELWLLNSSKLLIMLHVCRFCSSIRDSRISQMHLPVKRAYPPLLRTPDTLSIRELRSHVREYFAG